MSELMLNEWFQYGVQMAQYPNDKVRPEIQSYTQEYQAAAAQPMEPKYELEPAPPPLKDEHPDSSYDTSGRKMS